MDKGFWEYLTSGDAAYAVEGMDAPMFAIQARKNINKGNYKEAEEYVKMVVLALPPALHWLFYRTFSQN